MISIEVESITETMAELTPILGQHAQEVETHGLIFNPNFETYCQLDQLGNFLLVVARDENTEVVGYCGDFIQMDLHNQVVMAINDFAWVKPNYRKTGLFAAMIEVTEEAAICRGAKLRQMALKKPGTGPLGYTQAEILYQKVLGE